VDLITNTHSFFFGTWTAALDAALHFRLFYSWPATIARSQESSPLGGYLIFQLIYFSVIGVLGALSFQIVEVWMDGWQDEIRNTVSRRRGWTRGCMFEVGLIAVVNIGQDM
jgi:hypothetical protein